MSFSAYRRTSSAVVVLLLAQLACSEPQREPAAGQDGGESRSDGEGGSHSDAGPEADAGQAAPDAGGGLTPGSDGGVPPLPDGGFRPPPLPDGGLPPWFDGGLPPLPDGGIPGRDAGVPSPDAGKPVADAGSSPGVDAGSTPSDGGAIGACQPGGAFQLTGASEADFPAPQVDALRSLAGKADLTKVRVWEGLVYSVVLRRSECLVADPELAIDESGGALAGAKTLLARFSVALGVATGNDLSNLTLRYDEAVTSSRGTRFRRIELRQVYTNAPDDGGVVLTFINEQLSSIDGPLLVTIPNRPNSSPPSLPTPPVVTWPSPSGTRVDGQVTVAYADSVPNPPQPPPAARSERISMQVQQLDATHYALQNPGRMYFYSGGLVDGGVLEYTQKSCPTCFDAAPPSASGGIESAAHSEQATYFRAHQSMAVKDDVAQRFSPSRTEPLLWLLQCNGIAGSGAFVPGGATNGCQGQLPATIDGVNAEHYPSIRLKNSSEQTVFHEYGHYVDHLWNLLGGEFRDSKCPVPSGPIKALARNKEAFATMFATLMLNVSWGTGFHPNTGSISVDPAEHKDATNLVLHPANSDCSSPNEYGLAGSGSQVIRELALNQNVAPSSAWAFQQGSFADAAAARGAVLDAFFFAAKFMHRDASLPQFFDRFEQYYQVFHGPTAQLYAREVIAHHSLD